MENHNKKKLNSWKLCRCNTIHFLLQNITCTFHDYFFIGPFRNPCSAMQLTCLPSLSEKRGSVNVQASVLRLDGKSFSVAWVLIINVLPL